MIYSNIIQKSIQFASRKHRDQKRDILDYPYITHPLMVFHLVSKFSDDTDVLCAAILHDTVEDTETTLDEIEEEFGDKVKYLVDILSEDKSLEKTERKERYYKRIIEEKNRDILLIKSADILYNLTDFIETFEQVGKEKFLEMFSDFEKYNLIMKNFLSQSEKIWSENPFLYDIHFYLNKLDILLSEKTIIKKIACGIFPVYFNENGEKEFLLVKAKHGKIAQPKGHMEKGETYLKTAERELFEETGVKCSKIYTNYLITEQYIINKDNPVEKIVHSFIGVVDNKDVVIPEDEISAYFWVSAEKALEIITFDEQKKSFKEMLDILDKIEKNNI